MKIEVRKPCNIRPILLGKKINLSGSLCDIPPNPLQREPTPSPKSEKKKKNTDLLAHLSMKC